MATPGEGAVSYTKKEVALTRRQRLEVMRTGLYNDQQSFRSHWQELNDFLKPRKARFQVEDNNRGDRRNKNIIDSTATFALRTLSSGMMAGITSPSRPWFKLTVPDPDLAEVPSVKEWLHIVTKRMRAAMAKTNFYNVLPIMYTDMGMFATGAYGIFEDDEKVFRCQSFPIGSYMIGNDKNNQVNVFFREFRMTVRQLVEKFGYRKDWLKDEKGKKKIDWSIFSVNVKNLYEQGNLETWITICHVIMPNEDYDPEMAHPKFKKFVSLYYEKGTYESIGAESWDRYLEESGYDEFPIFVGRWEVTGEDVYGTDCPGMTALGDVKQLQLGEKRSAQAIEMLVRPPMAGPTSMKAGSASTIPGHMTYVDAREGTQKFAPVYEIDPRIKELEGKQEQKRQLIRRAFYEDLFLMLASTQGGPDMTATEVDERKEEKLLVLGPMLEQLNGDVLDPSMDRIFAIMYRKGQIPLPPEELQGRDLQIDYISIVAQAQKLVTVPSIERFTNYALALAPVVPDVLDKIDTDQLIDEYADATGVSPKIVRADEDAQNIRAGRQKQQAMQQAALTMKDAGSAAASLSKADTSGKNALTDLMAGAQGGGALAPV